MKKAFDCIDPSVLKIKLKNLGIEDEGLDWIMSFSTDRSQIAKLRNKEKGIIKNQNKKKTDGINIGVPEDTNIGLIIFLLYINDLVEYIFKENI